MSADMKSYVSELLEGYRARERKIAVLRYDLEHPSEVGVTEQIEAMNYGSGEGVGHSKGHVSNKTLYIALNYEEQAKQLNAESAKEIADELSNGGRRSSYTTSRFLKSARQRLCAWFTWKGYLRKKRQNNTA